MDDEPRWTNPIVIDNGSGFIKAGFGGEERPKCHFSSYVGRPKHPKVMQNTSTVEDIVVGPKVDTHRGILKCSYPMEHGTVNNWEDMEILWQYIYKNELKVSESEHPVLLTEAPLNPAKNREMAAQVFSSRSMFRRCTYLCRPC